MKRIVLALVTGLGLAAACSSDELVEAKKTAQDGGAGTAPTSKPDSSTPTPITPKRTVFSRNPFGDVGAKDNLIWDGDFEWFTPFGEQYGWSDVSFVVTNGTFSQVKVSTDCKSGMKCGYVTQNQRIAAVGVAAPAGQNVLGSIWAKPPTGDCSADFVTSLIACDFSGDPDVPLVDSDNKADASGYCHFEAVSPPRTHATCLYLEADFVEGEALVDDAVVRATTDPVTETKALSDSAQKHFDETRKLLPERLKPHPPQRALTEAFANWSRRRR